jgi:O-antigen/teichoic acid export membrane protein
MSFLEITKSRLSQNKNLVSALSSSYGLMALTITIQLVLVPLYLHHLGKENFGILIMILAVMNYGAIGITWLSGGMARILGERGAVGDTAGLGDAYAFSKLVYIGYAAITITVCWIVLSWFMVDALEKPELVQALILASLYFLVMYEYNTDRLAFIALSRQTTGNAIDAIGQIVFACGVAAGLYWGGGLVAVITSQIVGVLAARSLAWFYWHREGLPLHWKWPLIDSGPMWQRISGKMGQHYVLYGVLLLTLQADVLIIGWLAGPAVAAAYYLLWRIPEVCILLLGRIPSVFAPYLIQMDTREEVERIQSSYHKGLRIMLGLSALAGLGYAIAGNTLVHLWVGDNAPDGYLPYMLAGLALFFIAASLWPSGAAYALLKTGPLVRVTALQLAAKLVIFSLLFNSIDYLAPLVAIILTHVLGVFFLYLKIGNEACKAPKIMVAQY